jgi:predicted kinase
MKSFKNFTTEETLDEKLITFGGKAYPKSAQVVILAGSPGSGKSFTIGNILGIEGKIMDADKIKTLVIRSEHIAKTILDKTGIDVKELNLKNPKDVQTLHELLSSDPLFQYPQKEQNQIFVELMTIAYSKDEHKPNIIFDTMLERLTKLNQISSRVQEIGYKKENIHIVWVLTDIEVARKQNQERERTIDDDILLSMASGVSMTMKKLLSDSATLRKYADGDFWISANTIDVDSHIKKSDFGGSYVDKSNYFLIKKKGEAPKTIEEIGRIFIGGSTLLKKIKDYTPKIEPW